MKTKFENLVCKISQKVLELESSYLVYWLMLRSSPGKLLRTSAKFGQNYSFFDFYSISKLSAKSLHSVSGPNNFFRKSNFASFI